MAAQRRNTCRTLLRHCRNLGQGWAPQPPATEMLWGQGFYLQAGAHPLLVRVTPECLREGLSDTNQAFTPWLRRTLRHDLKTAVSLTCDAADDVSLYFQQQRSLAKCTSTSHYEGIRVDAVSGFVGQAEGRNVFTYNMLFTNTGTRRLRILSRQYDFVDASDSVSTQIKAETPEAAGVVGFTPLLEPGMRFQFGSGTNFSSVSGSVTGNFLVMVEPELSGEDAEFHKQMEQAELNIRVAYYKGLETEQFRLPLAKLQFSTELPSLSLRKK